MLIKTVSGYELGGAASHREGQEMPFVAAGSLVNVEFEFSSALLPGTYFVNAGVLGRIGDNNVYLDRVIDAVMFKVLVDTESRATGIVDFGMTSKILMLHTTSETKPNTV